MKDIIYTSMVLVMAIMLPFELFADPESYECGGTVTNIYTSPDISVSICHAPYTKFDLKNLINWQPCIDAIIYTTARNGVSTIHTDCSPDTYSEFKVSTNNLFVKHYYEAYPGFESKPLVVEEFITKTQKSTYTLSANLTHITKTQFESSLSQLEAELRKPFDGKTYFSAVYGAFSNILAYSTQEPEYALKVLAEYEKRGIFDGEVSEILSATIGYANLIQKTVQGNIRE
jgi:hypothetical protein